MKYLFRDKKKKNRGNENEDRRHTRIEVKNRIMDLTRHKVRLSIKKFDDY